MINNNNKNKPIEWTYGYSVMYIESKFKDTFGINVSLYFKQARVKGIEIKCYNTLNYTVCIQVHNFPEIDNLLRGESIMKAELAYIKLEELALPSIKEVKELIINKKQELCLLLSKSETKLRLI